MNRKQILSSLICSILTIPCMAQGTDGSSFVINEIQVSNIDQYLDYSNNYGSWIELYNPTSSSITLDGLYISDNAEKLKTFKITGIGSIYSKGFKVLYFDHNSADGQYGSNASKQVRFNLDADGGTIYISNSSGELITSFDYPAAISRCSYARTTDGGSTWGWTSQPTLAKTNTTSTFATTQLEAPTATTANGFLSGTMTVYVTAPEGATVTYTTDGSTPTTTSTTLSGGNIKVTKTTVLRLRAFKDGYLPSPVTTHSYLYVDRNYSVPVVSVVTDSKNLYDNTIGVYCVGTNGVSGRGQSSASNKNMDWERPVNFEYFDVNGVCHLNQEATFKVCGGWSRHWEPTSFKLKAEKQYEGKNFFDYAFFNEKPFIKNKCVILRNGGNDGSCRSKDATIQHIIQSSGIYLDGQSFNPCHVLLNGKYLALLNMREPSNKFFGYANYGLDTDYMDAFELSPDFGGQVLKAGTTSAWSKLLSIASYASEESSWEQIRDEYLDIDEFINYMAAECWLGCSDWLTNNNNTKWFRSTEGGKFHFVMFDTDSAFDNSNMLGSIKGSSNNNVMALFNRLAKNETFKNQFITAFCIIDGAVFTKARAEEAAQFVGSAMETGMSLENKSPWSSCNSVASNIAASSTHTARINSLKSYFGIATNPMSVKLNTNVSETVLTINDLPVPGAKFEGKLFGPAIVKATAPAGYNFVGWRKGAFTQKTLIGKGTSWNYYDQGSLDNTDWKTGDVSSWSKGAAPLGYAKDGIKTTLDYGSNSGNKRPTYYFRRNVFFEDAPGYESEIILNYVVDDGFAIYVNGVEAGRYNLSNNATYSSYANTYTSGNPDSGAITLDPSLFKKGNNAIAVEVHNNSGSSSDIYWDAEMLLSSSTEGTMVDGRDLTLTSESNSNYTAIFEPIPEEYLTPAGSTPVVINEVSASNSVFINDYFKKNDWVELYNTTSEPIDVAGMYLSDNADKPQKYQIMPGVDENSTIIPAHGYLIIWADKLDPLAQLHASFKLGNADGEMLMLTAEDGSWSDQLTYMTHTGEESVGRYPDGGRRVYKMTRPTIGRQNTLTTNAEWLSGEDKNFDIDEYLAAIEHVSESITEHTDYYTIDGIRLNGPQRGINIVRETHADGTVTTKKIIIR